MAAPRKKALKKARAGKRKRNYKAEYKRRLERARALGYSKSVARGHPREGELSRLALKQLRRAREIPSPGEQRRAGIKRPQSSKMRRDAREKIAELAGIKLKIPRSSRGTRRSVSAERFADKFVDLGLGTRQEAFSLYFSP